MAAGEFVEVYGGDEDGYGNFIVSLFSVYKGIDMGKAERPLYANSLIFSGTWDVVVTCFFIDTATNIISYLEVIHKILKEGGTWINIGMCYPFLSLLSIHIYVCVPVAHMKRVDELIIK